MPLPQSLFNRREASRFHCRLPHRKEQKIFLTPIYFFKKVWYNEERELLYAAENDYITAAVKRDCRQILESVRGRSTVRSIEKCPNLFLSQAARQAEKRGMR